MEFYVGTVAGVLERKATHTRNVPEVTGPGGATQHLVPFVALESGAAVEQAVAIDVLYAVLLR